jgi:hypothetical protein
MAMARGYAAKAPAPKVDPAPQKMDRIKQGQELSQSLTNVGGAKWVCASDART